MKRSIILFIIVSMLSGCWNIKEIQDIRYVTAIGIDFNKKKNTFSVFTQILDFSNIAKQEGSTPEISPPIWVGKSEGKTVQDAIDTLAEDAQQRLFWGHISAIVLSENVLKYRLKQSLDFVSRYREIRYNIWLFSTRENVEAIFLAKSFFKLPALTNILHEPNELYRQRSYIRPLRFFEYVAEASTPNETAYIPSLGLSKGHWQSDEEKKSMLKIAGAHFLMNHRLKGWLPLEDLLGMRWLEKEMEKSQVTVMENGEPLASIMVEGLRISVKKKSKEGVAIHVRGRGIMTEKVARASLSAIEKKTEKVIASEIMDAYRQGQQIHADVLGVNRWLDRWKLVGKKTVLFPYQLTDVNVDIHIISTGKQKNEKINLSQ
ncbi:Ger(x)C family spore germination protein [Anoxybacillus sp. J5B_2022]|uniref:Ger(x)C family spore germination protein n=1 Tax=Anoxybacillus sp. J5B_2022 TaxID=3003246 RepID=UPI0022864653|nr:Ger(x)C family spore germination protein [Anoxybacillus sp. J5B_2022]MCZ0756742.1 Ger(x)C family spore germination protein [Anoxybacillus sp. J5B_2022]